MATPTGRSGTRQPDSTAARVRRLNLSQSSLQDFTDCARRFQLRYLMDQAWPAPVAEPLQDAERADLLGRQFHRVMERHWLGLPVERATLDAALLPWWDAFIAHPPADLPGTERRPELHTTAVIHGQRIVATFDLLAYEPGGPAAIVDWKTSARRPNRTWLDRRLQTLIYPLLLVESAPGLLGCALPPEDVRFIYWFTNAPAEPEVFQYSTARYESDKRTLAALLDRLLAMEGETWPLTPNVELCRLCQYRSLCDRGRQAGHPDEEFELPEPVPEPAAPDDFVL